MTTHASPTAGTVTMYATSWCPFCRMLRSGLDRLGVTYTEIDVDRDQQAAAFVESVNGGNRIVPTVLFPDGTTLTNPPADEVLARLG